MSLCFSLYLIATLTLTFGYIKWISDVAFTGSFLDIVFGKYVGEGWAKTLPSKMWNDFIVASFHLGISTMVSYPFCEKQETEVCNQ